MNDTAVLADPIAVDVATTATTPTSPTTATSASTASPPRNAAASTPAKPTQPSSVRAPPSTSRPVSTRRPLRPIVPPSAPRTDLPYWLAWLLHAVDLDDLPIPAALFRRSILSSPFLYWLASCLLYLFNVTQQYNRIRNPPLLATHPHYHFTFVSLRRYEQCVAESWLAAGALLCCGMCVLLLSVAVLSSGPYITLSGGGNWRQEEQERQQQQQTVHVTTSRPAAAAAAVRRSGLNGMTAGESDSADDRHPSNWPCVAVLAVLFFAFYGLRYMATIKWPQYRHGNLWTVIR